MLERRAGFHHRDDFRSLTLGAGVPQLGPPGWRIQRTIATSRAPCAGQPAADGVADIKTGLATLEQLRSAAEAAKIIVEPRTRGVDP